MVVSASPSTSWKGRGLRPQLRHRLRAEIEGATRSDEVASRVAQLILEFPDATQEELSLCFLRGCERYSHLRRNELGHELAALAGVSPVEVLAPFVVADAQRYWERRGNGR